MVEQVFEDWRTAPIPERLRAMLGFLEKLTLHPEEMNAQDVDALQANGVTRAAAEDAITICFLFSIMNRLADAFDFDIPSGMALKGISRLNNITGYRLAQG